MNSASSFTTSEFSKEYDTVLRNIESLIRGETDWVAAMATVACELHRAFDHYHWTGFYRNVGERLIVGPYQGSHGCLRIDFGKGVCGTAAASKQTEVVEDVDSFPGHIACSATTKSEIVVPVLTPDGHLLAVLDIDSDYPAAFNEVDRKYLEMLCIQLGKQYSHALPPSAMPD